MTKVVKKPNIELYIKGYFHILFNNKKSLKDEIKNLENKLNSDDLNVVYERVNFYNKLSKPVEISKTFKVANLYHPKSPKAYYLDLLEYTKYFDDNLYLDFIAGDVNQLTQTPSIVKTRPIVENNNTNVLMNLDKFRHFVFIKNDVPFQNKKNLLIGRFYVNQQNRIDFFQKHFHNPLCNLGQVNKNNGNLAWYKKSISLQEHLKHKFILSLQGHDVATNLKWIMSSNSIAVMPKPTVESWYMESKLIGGIHYIEILPDYSDLDEKINYYIDNEQECLNIIQNANNYIKQFQNPNIEKLCSLLVLEKYFKFTN